MINITSLEERANDLFKQYGLYGSATQMFITRFFYTHDLADLTILRVANLPDKLRKDLASILREYFKNKQTAPEVEAQEQLEKFVPEDSNGTNYERGQKHTTS
ncbi:hypothetical protein [Clostridium felsineum]|uniref:Uncharacterized protein n=1 Tax=Clostridium felsineum TaxID=36839 RepID=A0A1S8MDQ1_9CLOT|nr:hypothetical protein [Clostridium felsineum]URZ06429.1 hypothetical protein CLROS_017620 [Clostridium felsineum]URZ11464.1 hypothetical protein CROST_021810 [Clostridium felsineum]